MVWRYIAHYLIDSHASYRPFTIAPRYAAVAISSASPSLAVKHATRFRISKGNSRDALVVVSICTPTAVDLAASSPVSSFRSSCTIRNDFLPTSSTEERMIITSPARSSRRNSWRCETQSG
jgi:hypothetical protein